MANIMGKLKPASVKVKEGKLYCNVVGCFKELKYVNVDKVVHGKLKRFNHDDGTFICYGEIIGDVDVTIICPYCKSKLDSSEFFEAVGEIKDYHKVKE